VDVSLGFICIKLRRVSFLARKINLKARSQSWNFGLLAVSSKSLFISFSDYVERRDETGIGIVVLGYREEGFNPHVLISDLFPPYKVVASYFKTCLHQLCITHRRRDIAKMIKDLPAETKKDKFFLE